MEQDELIRAIVTLLILGIIIPLSLWYWGMRRNSSTFKTFAVVIAVSYFAVAAIELSNSFFGTFEETFRTGFLGPPRRATEASTVGESPYYVKHPEWRHPLDLLPVAKIGEKAVGPLTVRYEVHAPDGTMLAKGQETVQPLKADQWTAIHTQFPTHEQGVHKLIVEVPKPAGEVKATIREVK
jgi:hypothetical protein